MTAITFDSNTIWNKRGKPPVIRIDAGEQGRICFSTEAVKLLGLKEGMRITFRIYKEDKDIIYFYQQATGIPLKQMQVVKSGSMMAIYCRPMAKNLLAHFNYDQSGHKTFTLMADTVVMPDTSCCAWFILKNNIHKPIQWKRK